MKCPKIHELPSPPSGKVGWPWTGQILNFSPNNGATGHWPKISIVTPSYNQGQFLEETIRSVLLQGYPNLEYIIIDGGSNDNSIDIIEKYKPFLSYWVSEKDHGQSNAINKGFKKSNGDILGWLNSDDFYTQGTLHRVALYAKKYKNAGAFAGGAEARNIKGKILSRKYPPGLTYHEILYWDTPNLPQPSCFFRKIAWDKCGPLNEMLHFQMDYDLWLNIAKSFNFVIIPEILSTYLIHNDAKTMKGKYKAEHLLEKMLVLVNHSPNVGKQIAVMKLQRYLLCYNLAIKCIPQGILNIINKPIKTFLILPPL